MPSVVKSSVVLSSYTPLLGQSTAAIMDDPFACFGESDDEDGWGTGTGAREEAARLVEEANARLPSRSGAAAAAAAAATAAAPAPPPPREEPMSPPCLPGLWPDRPPLYFGPMEMGADGAVGGGRGYRASRRLPPGTLLLAEEAAFRWPPEQLGRELGLVSILSLVREEGGGAVVRDLERFHPTREAVLRLSAEEERGGGGGGSDGAERVQIREMMDDMRLAHAGKDEGGGSPMMNRILEEAADRGVTSGDGTPLTPDDVFRMLLALRYNGFETGVYPHFSIFNHDENPNCLKFRPEVEARGWKAEDSEGGGGRGGSIRHRDLSASFSEIRTTRAVERGEALTISYLDPRELSHATRRHHLWEQHRFDIGDGDTDGLLREMDLVGGKIPKSSKHHRREDAALHLEMALEELEGHMAEIKSSIHDGEAAKAMEMGSLELVASATDQLENESHVLLIRVRRLHLDAAEAVTRLRTDDLTPAQINGVMCRFVETALKLLPLQTRYLGRDHPDIARTCQDLSQGIGALLAHAPKQLFSLKLDGLEGFANCSQEEDRYRRECERINALYPRNTEELSKRQRKLADLKNENLKINN